MKCRVCGRELRETARFCGKCGAPVVRMEAAAQHPGEPYADPVPAGGRYDPDNPDHLPKEDLVPLTTAQCVWLLVAMLVPVLNVILMLKWAYSERGNESRRSLARAGLILLGVVLAVLIVVLACILAGLQMGFITVPRPM